MLLSRAETVRLLSDIAIILLISILAGTGINFIVLKNTWSGKAVVSSELTTASAIPLPLGAIQVKELFDKKEAVIIDTRDRNAYASGHIKGAISLPLMESVTLVKEFTGRVPKSALLVVYCNGYACEDSIELGKQLISQGYRTVYYFDGGFPAWRDAKYPVAGGKK